MAKDIFNGMTEEMIRQRVITEAQMHHGIKEGSIEHKRIVDTYNSQRKLPRGYALKETDPWCAAFMSYIGIILGISDVILPEVSCDKMIELYKTAGRWEESDKYVPKPGDLVMYDWDAKSGECTGDPDHVGMVVSVDGKNIRVIEGNYKNKVEYRDICVEYIKTRGFCLPDYAKLVHGFTDVPQDAWYRDDVLRATELGLMEGVGDNKFEPDRPLTRAEAAAVAVRIVDKLK